MSSMTVEERIQWEYVDMESNELMLDVLARIKDDGFQVAMPDPNSAVETLALKVLSQAMVKTLALLVEKLEHPSLAMAYMQMAPMHAELVKLYTLKEK